MFQATRHYTLTKFDDELRGVMRRAGVDRERKVLVIDEADGAPGEGDDRGEVTVDEIMNFKSPPPPEATAPRRTLLCIDDDVSGGNGGSVSGGGGGGNIS